jgi:hypothetical protein
LLVRRTMSDAPPLPHGCAPAPIAAVIDENLDRRPEARAADARAFGAALVRAAHEGGIAGAAGLGRTLPLGSVEAAPRIERTVHASAAGRRRRAPPLPRTHLALLIAACFLAGALAAASTWRFGLRRSTASEDTPQPSLDAGDARGALAP